MGLKVWLPLITDEHNQGASSTIPIQTGVTFTNPGKIGTCGYFSGTSTSYIDTNYSTAIGTNDFSVALWLKLPAITSGSYFAICTSKTAAAASAGFGIYWNYSQKKFLWSTADGSAGTEIWMATAVDSIVYDKWIHLVMIRDNNDSKKGFFYINGTRYELASVPIIRNITTDTKMHIGKCTNGSYPTKMYVNDFRIYDHALSAAEVKEIAQGLVLHYKLDGIDIPNENLGNTSADYHNFSDGYTKAASSWGGDAGTVTFHHSGGYAGLPYKELHKTATGTGGIYSKTADDIVLEANTTYTMSCWIKSSRNFRPIHYSFNINRGVGNVYITYGSSFDLTTEWQFFSKTFTTTEDQAGSYGEMSIIYDDDVTDYYIYYSGFKIEKGTVATRWTPPGIQYTTIQDSSGYNYNATLNITTSINTSNGRYNFATYFGTYNTPVATLNTPEILPALTNCTITYWAKYDTTKTLLLTGHTTSHYLMASDNNNYYHQNAGTLTIYRDGVQGTYKCTANEWHFFVITGVNLSTWTTMKINGYGSGWPLKGVLSDFRIYATQLSQDSIRQLYEVGAKVDNKQNLHTFEIKELSSNIFRSELIMSWAKPDRTRIGEIVEHNGYMALNIAPEPFYKNISDTIGGALDGMFQTGSYVFDMWIDVDSVISGGVNRAGGMIIRYTDNSQDSAFVFTGGNLGYQHKIYITPANKTVQRLEFYYYTSTDVFYRIDSCIYPINEAKFFKTGIVQNGGFLEDTKSRIIKNGIIEANEIIEL